MGGVLLWLCCSHVLVSLCSVVLLSLLHGCLVMSLVFVVVVVVVSCCCYQLFVVQRDDNEQQCCHLLSSCHVNDVAPVLWSETGTLGWHVSAYLGWTWHCHHQME